jgi:hypothetical protein
MKKSEKMSSWKERKSLNKKVYLFFTKIRGKGSYKPIFSLFKYTFRGPGPGPTQHEQFKISWKNQPHIVS